ncbi:GNAT family N-acetyltransferase [Streptosporangium sp. KLBMP 9127]|nr:GNAT family N-acetyltransferase [Streptosporangium sp. KLBMP 9127]
MDIRDLTVGDLGAVLDNRKRAFGPVAPADVEIWQRRITPSLSQGRCLGAFDGPRLVATSRIIDLVQWWHGRPMSMGGVAGVTVAPEERGRGLGRLIMRATIERCAALGHSVSALFPATTPLYRGLGWEHAGAQYDATLRPEALRSIRQTEQVKLRRIGPDDAPAVRAVLDRVYGENRASGPIGWDEHSLRIWLDTPDDFRYAADDGFVVYRWNGQRIDVDNLVAGSEATARALWAMVGTSSTIAQSVRACVAPDDPVFWLVGERTTDQVAQARWMFRVIDVAAALAGRGFPLGATLDTVIEVADPERAANSGGWHLRVAGGTGTASPAAPSRSGPRLSVGGFSALFAGVPMATLRRAGLVSGGDGSGDDELDTAFRATPYMLDNF